MAKEVKSKNSKKHVMEEPITCIGFDSKSKRTKKLDGKVLAVINEYAGVEQNSGIPPKTLIRKFLLKTLPKEIIRLRNIAS